MHNLIFDFDFLACCNSKYFCSLKTS